MSEQFVIAGLGVGGFGAAVLASLLVAALTESGMPGFLGAFGSMAIGAGLVLVLIGRGQRREAIEQADQGIPEEGD